MKIVETVLVFSKTQPEITPVGEKVYIKFVNILKHFLNKLIEFSATEL